MISIIIPDKREVPRISFIHQLRITSYDSNCQKNPTRSLIRIVKKQNSKSKFGWKKRKNLARSDWLKTDLALIFFSHGAVERIKSVRKTPFDATYSIFSHPDFVVCRSVCSFGVVSVVSDIFNFGGSVRLDIMNCSPMRLNKGASVQGQQCGESRGT